jgi:hypothetical protein
MATDGAPPATGSSRSIVVLRYLVAFVALTYGLAKLTGAQFVTLDSARDTPMGEVPGFWLTWYYFGYAWPYKVALALAEVVPAILLLFPRTALLGACVLAGVLGNVILVDVFYDVDRAALLIALLLEAGLLRILASHRRALLALFWPPPAPDGRAPARGAHRAMPAVARTAVIAAAAALMFRPVLWPRPPGALEGRWRVTAAPAALALEGQPLTHVYFERQRPWCVLRFGRAMSEPLLVELDAAAGTLQLWQDWRQQRRSAFRGRFRREGERLVLAGERPGVAGEAVIELQRW